jgi:3-oxoacyl-[acyl-carrier protein] reductase
MFSLSGCKALITGGGGAIGRATALRMLEQGADVALCDMSSESLESAASWISEQIGKSVSTIVCDLSNANEATSIVQKTEDAIGALDIVVNNAGITKDMLILKMTEDEFDSVLNVNLKAVFILTKAAVSVMSRRRFGRVINISSVVGFTGNPGQANYCASKAGVVGMSKAVALEYAGRGVTVNCIAPGAIASPMINKLSEQALENFVSKIPMHRIGDPDDIAHACCFLSSKEASYITGQTIHVNGGMLMA